MVNHVGTFLSQLIRERAYRAGDLERLDETEDKILERIRLAKLELQKTRKKKASLAARIDELNKQIKVRADLDVTKIRTIRHTPKLGGFKYGDLTAEIVRIVKEAGQPLPTSIIVRAIVSAFNLPYDTPENRMKSRRRVTGRLQAISRKGAITRHHAFDLGVEGIWSWTGL